MLYTMYYNEFSLPGSNSDQFTIEAYPSKREFLEHIEWSVSESRDVIVDLEGDDNDDDSEVAALIDEFLENLEGMISDPDIENKDLSELYWEIGCYRFEVVFAEYFPQVLKGFRNAILYTADSMFDEFEDMTPEELDECEECGDGYIEAYRALYRINKDMSEEDFRKEFDILQDAIGDCIVFG